jgi:hypothetical protein
MAISFAAAVEKTKEGASAAEEGELEGMPPEFYDEVCAVARARFCAYFVSWLVRGDISQHRRCASSLVPSFFLNLFIGPISHLMAAFWYNLML